MKTGKFLWDLGLTVSSGGFYRTFKETLKSFIGTEAIKDYGVPFAMQVTQNAFEAFMKKDGGKEARFKLRMLEEAKKIDKYVTSELVDFVYEELKPKAASTLEKAKEFFKSTVTYFTTGGFDTTGVSAFADCKTDTKDAKVKCLKALLGIAGNLDPSGIITLVTAFVYPQCPKEKLKMKRKFF